MRRNFKIVYSCLFLISIIVSSGCDQIYRRLHPEGAEEKDLLGNISLVESNPNLAIVQKLLKLYGYPVGNPDGILGANTREAVGQFQQDAGLQVNKFIDRATWDKLSEFIDLGLVVKGNLNHVMIQKALKKAGFDSGSHDGRVGKKTQQAIIDFQKANDLKGDGRIGYKTLKALAPYCPKIGEK